MKGLLEFYSHFAAAFGTCVLVIWAIVLIAQVHLDPGLCGSIAMLLVSLVYAIPRLVSEDELNEVRAASARLATLENQAAAGQKDDGQRGVEGDGLPPPL